MGGGGCAVVGDGGRCVGWPGVGGGEGGGGEGGGGQTVTNKYHIPIACILLYQNIKKTRPFDWFTNRKIYDSRGRIWAYIF